MHYEIVEGVKIEGSLWDSWDFGEGRTGEAPVFYSIKSEHPDGPEGYRHPYWDDGRSATSGCVKSIEEAQRIVSLWTPERRRKFLTKDPAYWLMPLWFLDQEWMTSSGRQKFRQVYSQEGALLAGLSITDDDFQHGITLEIMFLLRTYILFGFAYERDPEDSARWAVPLGIGSVKDQLAAPETPAPVRSLFRKWERLHRKSVTKFKN